MLKGLTLTQLKLSDDKFFPLLESYIKEIDDWALTDVPCSNIKRKDDAYLQKVRQYAAREDVWFDILAILFLKACIILYHFSFKI